MRGSSPVGFVVLFRFGFASPIGQPFARHVSSQPFRLRSEPSQLFTEATTLDSGAGPNLTLDNGIDDRGTMTPTIPAGRDLAPATDRNATEAMTWLSPTSVKTAANWRSSCRRV